MRAVVTIPRGGENITPLLREEVYTQPLRNVDLGLHPVLHAEECLLDVEVASEITVLHNIILLAPV